VRVRPAGRQSLQRLRCAWHLHNYSRWPTCGAGQVQCATSGFDPVDETGNSGVTPGAVDACSAVAVVGDDDLHTELGRGDEHTGVSRTRMLGDVRQAFGDDEVGHGFGFAPDPALESNIDSDGDRRTTC